MQSLDQEFGGNNRLWAFRWVKFQWNVEQRFLISLWIWIYSNKLAELNFFIRWCFSRWNCHFRVHLLLVLGNSSMITRSEWTVSASVKRVVSCFTLQQSFFLPEWFLSRVSVSMWSQRNFLTKTFEAEFAFKWLVPLMLHFFMPYQWRVVSEDDVALIALVAVFMLQIIVHRKFVFGRERFVAQFAQMLSRLVDNFQVVVMRFSSPHERSVHVVWAEAVLLMSSEFGVKCEAMIAVGTFYGSWNVVVTIEMRVESLLGWIFMSWTLIALELPQFHVHWSHVTLYVVLELRWQSAQVARHFSTSCMVKRHVTV